jgi:hypothetical protein
VQRLLIIGWRSAREMADLLRTLSKVLLPGSEVHFLSAVDASVREAALRSEMGSLLAALSEMAGGIVGSDVAVHHHTGSPLASEAYAQLPLADATVAIVLGDATVMLTNEDLTSYSGGAARARDARTFHITTLLRKRAPELRLVPIYDDILSNRLITPDSPLVAGAETGSGVTSVLHRNSLETGLIAMQADDPTLVFVFSQLLALGEQSHKLFAVPFAVAWADLQLGEPADELSFNEVATHVRELQGHVLVGYYDAELDEVLVNSHKKDLPRKWRPADQLIMLRGHQ